MINGKEGCYSVKWVMECGRLRSQGGYGTPLLLLRAHFWFTCQAPSPQKADTGLLLGGNTQNSLGGWMRRRRKCAETERDFFLSFFKSLVLLWNQSIIFSAFLLLLVFLQELRYDSQNMKFMFKVYSPVAFGVFTRLFNRYQWFRTLSSPLKETPYPSPPTHPPPILPSFSCLTTTSLLSVPFNRSILVISSMQNYVTCGTLCLASVALKQ